MNIKKFKIIQAGFELLSSNALTEKGHQETIIRLDKQMNEYNN